MNRIDRLFGILMYLQSKKFVSAEQISDRFTISVRTVYRDVKALNESGIPVSFEPNRGYFVVQGFFLAPVAFNTEEANALLLMEKIVGGFADKATQDHYRSAMTKIKTVMHSSEKEKLAELDENMGFQTHEMLLLKENYIPAIQKAITQKTLLEIHYKNQKDETSKRSVEPIGLIFYAFSWHLIAWCQLRQDYRDFKLTRLLGLKNLELPFSKTDHIPFADFMRNLPVKY